MNKQLWDIWKDSKYRVDFTYQTKHGFVWRETVDLLDNKYDAKEFILDVYYNPCFLTKEEEILYHLCFGDINKKGEQGK